MQLQLNRTVWTCLTLNIATLLVPLHQMVGQQAGAEAELKWQPGEEQALLGQDSESASAPDPLAVGNEILVFDWNKGIATRQGRYIEGTTQWQPNNTPVRNNFDWTAPPNFANGTYYVRVLIRKMRANDNFKIIFNHWQMIGGKLAETNMQPSQLSFQYRGAPINRTFTFPVKNLKSNHTWDPRHFAPFSWKVKRDLVGFFFPNFSSSSADAKLASNVYPIDLRFTVVCVAPGGTFSGWQRYLVPAVLLQTDVHAPGMGIRSYEWPKNHLEQATGAMGVDA